MRFRLLFRWMAVLMVIAASVASTACWTERRDGRDWACEDLGNIVAPDWRGYVGCIPLN